MKVWRFITSRYTILFLTYYLLVSIFIKVLSYTPLNDCGGSSLFIVCTSWTGFLFLLLNLPGYIVSEIFVILSPKGDDTFYPLFREHTDTVIVTTTLIMLLSFGIFLDWLAARRK